ncbi:MAG: heme-binding protein [Actinobacteria bacterium]|nr:heme-binding protein [Actinomycetota bacterium]
MTEIQSYRVLKSYPGFELREYEPHTLVTTWSQGDLGSSAYNAFGYLASFIGGNNQRRQAIAMTAPVVQRQSGSGFEVSFVMPAGMTEVPNPNSSALRIESFGRSKFAAVRFSGFARESLFRAKEEKLRELCAKQGFTVIGEPRFARYNGPWTPGPLRRNEVLLEIASA